MEVTVIPHLSKENVYTAKIRQNKKNSWYLHDEHYPLQQAKKWAETIDLSEKRLVVVLGFGLGYHIKALLDVLPQGSFVVVVEAASKYNSFALAKNVINRPVWIDDERLRIINTDNIRSCASEIVETMWQHSIASLAVCEYEPVMRLFPAFYEDMKGLLEKSRDLFSIKVNFPATSGHVYAYNSWENLSIIAKKPGLASFKDYLKNKLAIIVAAGPSLDDNIHLLKGQEDKVLIIAAGSAIGALHKNNIKAHFVVVIDPFDPEGKHADEIVNYADNGTVLVAAYEVPNSLLQKYPGPIVFAGNTDNYFPAEMKAILPDNVDFIRNVSVSSQALFFALYIGANPVVFIGQDLAFPAMKSHATGVSAGSYLNTGAEYYNVKGRNGEDLLTTVMLKDLKEFYEHLVQVLDKKTIINASAGGVRINGMKEMSLQKVINKFARNSSALSIIECLAMASSSEIDNQEKLVPLLAEITDWLCGMAERIALFKQGSIDKMQAVATADLTGFEQLVMDMERELQDIIQQMRKHKFSCYIEYMLIIQEKLMQFDLAKDDNVYRRGQHISIITDNLRIIIDNIFKRVVEAIIGIKPKVA